MSNSYIRDEFQPYLDKLPESALKDYITSRVIDQIDWYDKKSVVKQKMYKRLSIISIVMTGIIPVAVLISEFGIVAKILIAALSAAAGILNAVIALCSFKDLWVQYRMNCETLKSILYCFFLRVGEFKDMELDDLALKEILVSRCEEILTSETKLWNSAVRNNSNGSKGTT